MLEEVAAKIQAAIADVLASLPHADYGPVVLNGTVSGHLLHAGHPETAVGFEVVLGSGIIRPTSLTLLPCSHGRVHVDQS